MSLLSSISPHRFFNRFSKQKHLDVPGELEPPVEHLDTNNEDFFDLFSPKDVSHSFIDDISSEKTKFDIDTTADLICTAASTGIWSLADDNQAQNATLNATSIHEECSNTKKSDLFLSPDDLFLRNSVQIEKGSPKLLSSPMEDTMNRSTSSRKRKLSDPPDSPCMLLASQIENYGSPASLNPYMDAGDKSSSKVWPPQLDNALGSCYAKYLRFHEEQSPDTLAFKNTSQNKILARMLFNKTGVERTAKQISSRLIRMNKIRSETFSASELRKDSSHLGPDMPIIMSSPLNMIGSSLDTNPLDLTLDELTMSFIYNSPIHGEHSFSKLVSTDPESVNAASTLDVKKRLQIEHSVFSSDFDKLAAKLSAQQVPIYSVSSQINLQPNENATSTPSSPFTNPKSFSIENGNYLCHLRMKVAPTVSNDDFLSWKSYICLYKENNTVISKSREQINGYRGPHGSFELQVPFLNNFWAGYLTFLSNGSNAFKDLKDIHIAQVIYDGDDESLGTIHGYFVYKFDVAKLNQGNTTYSCIKILSDQEVDVDDNETVLASSSPEKPSSSKASLSVNTALANMNSTPSSMGMPTYNASVLQKFNFNYQHPDSRTPVTMRPVSASAAFHLDVPFQRSPDYLNTPASLSTVGGRRQSAGQIMPHLSNDAVQMEPHPSAQFPQGISYAPLGPFQVPVAQPPQQTLPNNHYPIQYPQGMPMMPLGVNDGPNEHILCNPTEAQAATPVIGGHVPPSQWGMRYHGQNPFVQAPINSAPASQVQFFPKNPTSLTADQKNMSKSGPTITFGPILGYDPSKDMKEHTKKNKSSINFHKFLLNPQVMYKPRKK